MSDTHRPRSARERAEGPVAGQTRALELIVGGAPLPRVLEELCRTIEQQADRALFASVLLLDRDQEHLRHGAAPGLSQDYNDAIDGIAIGPSAGSCGTAAYRKQAVVVSDIAADPLWADFRDLAVGHGLRACWSTPILAADGAVLGTFAVYYRRPSLPTDWERQLVALLTRTAAVAIERQRAEEERRGLDEAVRAERQRLYELVQEVV